MGTFFTGCKVENHQDAKRSAVVKSLLVDTGSEYTWIPEQVLRRIGVEPQKKDIQLQMANGQVLTRTIGFAVLRVSSHFTIDEVVFAQPGDMTLLGARTMEGMNLLVDSQRKRLMGAGPVPAATAVRPHVAKRMGIIVPGPRPKSKAQPRTRPAIRRRGPLRDKPA